MKLLHRIPAGVPAFILALSLAACTDEGPGDAGTAVFGRLVDPQGAPVPDAEVGVTFFLTSTPLAEGIHGPAGAAQGGAQLGLPYANPSANAGLGEDVSVPVQVTTPTSILLEVRETRLGVSATVATLHNGAIASTTTFSWDGRYAVGGLVPNGLYSVRLTQPDLGQDEGPALVSERLLLVNRSALQLDQNPSAMNTRSDFDGRFSLEDLPVGVSLDMTNDGGEPLGTGRVRSQVQLVIRHPDFAPKDQLVAIGPGEEVDLVIQLTPVVTAAQPPEPVR
jgi:hypothetical protein